MAVRQDLYLRQGETYAKIVRWESERLAFVPIASITRGAPTRVGTQAPHGIPDGWRCAIVSVQGMTQINAAELPPAPSDYQRVSITGPTVAEFPGINSTAYRPFTQGGYVQFYMPVDLAGFTARMSIKTKVGGALLLSLTAANGGIVIDNAAKQIIISISAAATAPLAWRKGVYDLELESQDGVVTTLLQGAVFVTPEVTT